MAPPVTREPRPERQRGFRRLTGLDRSGPIPRQTRKGQPLRPLTLPNLVGYVRLASIPVFLYLAFESDDGRSTAAALIYFWITFGDYLDGFLARATGQYSRLGAIMDPLIDRLATLAGAAVCWHFELLPRWSIVALAVRELATMALARAALRRGLELQISWVGRVGTFLVFAGLFWTLVLDTWVTVAVFIAGVVVGVYATALYARAGLRAMQAVAATFHEGSSST
jgi:phosphatidylglycerophosphate synthase